MKFFALITLVACTLVGCDAERQEQWDREARLRALRSQTVEHEGHKFIMWTSGSDKFAVTHHPSCCK